MVKWAMIDHAILVLIYFNFQILSSNIAFTG